jgi:tRNA G10  N-methylase Trm11
MQSLVILGRQPDLGLAELISLYGEDKVERINVQAAVIDIDPCNFKFDRLGGSTKFAKLLSTIETTDWADIEKFLVTAAPDQSKTMPEGKMTLGISVYGFNMNFKSILTAGIKLKKAIQKTGRSVRIVPNKTNELSAAQIIHNKLTSDKAWDLLIIKGQKNTFVAQTIKGQDIEGYTRRDQKRPFRDSRIGMLPPKLAQIIINLAVGLIPEAELTSICEDGSEASPASNNYKLKVLDPFCGTGVVLQEASLMGYSAIGSDFNDRMVDYSIKNIRWLKTEFKIEDNQTQEIFLGDAITTKWPKFDSIACESNLGKPLSALPSSQELRSVIKQADEVIEGFLKNLAKQSSSSQRFCIAVPAWQISENRFQHLPVLDLIEDLGYNFVDFKNISSEQLIYYRPGQVVARQLLVITRK